MRRIYKMVDGVLTDVTERVEARRGHIGLQVVPDIEPYQNVAVDGEWITSRTQHKEMLRRHGFVEVGNERMPYGEAE